MDTRSGKSVPKHEEMYSGAAHGNCTKAQRRADNVPMRSQRSDKCSPFDKKGLAVNTNLFCQPCFTSPIDKLPFNRKGILSISARHKKAEKIFPSTPGRDSYGPAHKTDPVTTREHQKNAKV
ncbi:hypothetical protein Tco_0316720 [Tanacetum coccineum]